MIAHNSSDNPSDSSSGKPVPGKEEGKKELNAFQFYEQEGFGTISGFMAERIGFLIDDFGEASLIAAMQESVLQGARNLKYVEAILLNPKKNSGDKKGGKFKMLRKMSLQEPYLKNTTSVPRFG
ncbi:hypothetical protein ABE28_009125 [Peribacillus muralis]|uniref:DnaB/C C-terminal domain-containing protein n=2 Tax=Peribacillus muralis TaxID=264697 RepID=A0A1B3XMT4_9BACI|nr:hypothetical protein ABE28_009125 [Peribacillus muralis]